MKRYERAAFKRPMTHGKCECADAGCVEHTGRSVCGYFGAALRRVRRVDMYDVDGTRMCDGCAADALDSGVFTTGKGRS